MEFNANSGFMYVVVAIVIAFVILQSVVFLAKAWKRGLQLGMEKKALLKTVSTSAPGKLAQGDKAIIWTTLETGPKSVVFRFTGAAALQGKGFRLNDPERYVVDLEGGWGFELPKLPANPLVMGIRAGKQGANTRLVFDLAKALDNCRIVKINPETLEVRIR